MDGPSNSSRKRPRDALAGATTSGAMGTTPDEVMVRKSSSSCNVSADSTERKGGDMYVWQLQRWYFCSKSI